MIKQAIIDTNIVYYLAGVSENIKFDIEPPVPQNLYNYLEGA